MVDERTNDAKEIIEFLKEVYGGKLHIFSHILWSVRASKISRTGKSIYTYDPDGKVAVYEILTREVLASS